MTTPEDVPESERARKPLTPEQREQKNLHDRERRAAQAQDRAAGLPEAVMPDDYGTRIGGCLSAIEDEFFALQEVAHRVAALLNFASCDDLREAIPHALADFQSRAAALASITNQFAALANDWPAHAPSRAADAALRHEVESLRSLPFIESATRDDWRLSACFEPFDQDRTAADIAARLGDCLDNTDRHPDTAQHVRNLREHLATYAAQTLEAELFSLIFSRSGRYGHRDDGMRAVVSRLRGWDGRGGTTLRQAGVDYGVSGERARQLAFDLESAWQDQEVYVPALDRALAVVARALPAPASIIEGALAAAGISGGPFRLEGLAEAARTLGRDRPWLVLELDADDATIDMRFVCEPQHERLLPNMLAAARRTVLKEGLANLNDVASQIAGSVDESAAHSRTLIAAFCAVPGFVRLGDDGWFTFLSQSNRLQRAILRLLTVAPALSLTELHLALEHAHGANQREVRPPQLNLLRAFVAHLPGCRLESDTIIAEIIPVAPLFNSAESMLIEVLHEHGSVLTRRNALSLCKERGFNPILIDREISTSALFTRPERGLVALVGQHFTTEAIAAALHTSTEELPEADGGALGAWAIAKPPPANEQ